MLTQDCLTSRVQLTRDLFVQVPSVHKMSWEPGPFLQTKLQTLRTGKSWSDGANGATGLFCYRPMRGWTRYLLSLMALRYEASLASTGTIYAPLDRIKTFMYSVQEASPPPLPRDTIAMGKW